MPKAIYFRPGLNLIYSIICTVSRTFDGVWKAGVQNSNPIKCYWWCIYNACMVMCYVLCNLACLCMHVTHDVIYIKYFVENLGGKKLEISVWLWEVRPTWVQQGVQKRDDKS